MTLALTARNLTKRFGGLTAVHQVSLTVQPGTIHAVIGPNGAGKSTLTNLLSGELVPTEGSVHLGDQELRGSSPQRRSQLGLGRTYQKTNIFGSFTAFENCRLAAQSRHPKAWHLWSAAAALEHANETAFAALHRVGLGHRGDIAAGTLSHGEQRQLEIGMALATGPKVLLLDEPLAGTGAAEARRLIDLLQQLRQAHAILLIEHDMDAVFTLAQQLTVMVDGRVLSTGTPDEVRGNEEVQKAYLGSDARAAA